MLTGGEMPPSKPFYFWRMFAALLLVSILFLLIFSFTYSITFLLQERTLIRAGEIQDDIDDISAYLDALKCNDSLIQKSSGKLMDGVYKMSILEREFGKDDRNVIKQKKEFSKLQYQHMNLILEFNEKCNKSYIILYYFYSNLEEDKELQDLTDTVSFILGNFQKRHGENIMLYSLDYNIDSFPIIHLNEKFNITNPPVVIIQGERKTQKIVPRNIDELEEIFSRIKKEERYSDCLSKLEISNSSKYNLTNKLGLNESMNYSLMLENSNFSYNFSYDNSSLISEYNLTEFEINFSENYALPAKCREFFNLTNLTKNYFEANFERILSFPLNNSLNNSEENNISEIENGN